MTPDEERARNRAEHPEIAEAIDFLRSRGVTIAHAWVEDAEGAVIAGRRPTHVMDEVWIDSVNIENFLRDFAPRQPKVRGRR